MPVRARCQSHPMSIVMWSWLRLRERMSDNPIHDHHDDVKTGPNNLKNGLNLILCVDCRSNGVFVPL